VVGLDHAFVRDHYALLGLVMGYVIEQAVAREDEGFRKRVDDISTRVAEAETADEVFPLGLELKELVSETGGSARARAAMGAMERLVPGNLHAEVPGAVEITRAGIPSVAEAVARGDGPAAAARMRAMTEELGALVARELARRGLIEGVGD
jgi:DNA-binding GntR family transcriptional regulator